MKEAGLTHGGFCGHFKNRDDLLAAASHPGVVAERELLSDRGFDRVIRRLLAS
jgi:hypothetical protein